MSAFNGLRAPDRRVMVVTGHYGSGKTEFCVSLALRLAETGFAPYQRLALVDLDIANPYFRSRERRETLEGAGVKVYGSAYEHEITMMAASTTLKAESAPPEKSSEPGASMKLILQPPNSAYSGVALMDFWLVCSNSVLSDTVFLSSTEPRRSMTFPS